jgi:Rrf2 family protein
MFEMARLGDGARDTVRNLAEAADVPYDYARTIARDLAATGLLKSRRGVGGGVELARPSHEISMLDIFRAMEEPASLSLCTQGTVCHRSTGCPVHVGVWKQLDGVIEDFLSNSRLDHAVTLADTLDAKQA